MEILNISIFSLFGSLFLFFRPSDNDGDKTASTSHAQRESASADVRGDKNNSSKPASADVRGDKNNSSKSTKEPLKDSQETLYDSPLFKEPSPSSEEKENASDSEQSRGDELLINLDLSGVNAAFNNPPQNREEGSNLVSNVTPEEERLPRDGNGLIKNLMAEVDKVVEEFTKRQAERQAAAEAAGTSARQGSFQELDVLELVDYLDNSGPSPFSSINSQPSSEGDHLLKNFDFTEVDKIASKSLSLQNQEGVPSTRKLEELGETSTTRSPGKEKAIESIKLQLLKDSKNYLSEVRNTLPGPSSNDPSISISPLTKKIEWTELRPADTERLVKQVKKLEAEAKIIAEGEAVATHASAPVEKNPTEAANSESELLKNLLKSPEKKEPVTEWLADKIKMFAKWWTREDEVEKSLSKPRTRTEAPVAHVLRKEEKEKKYLEILNAAAAELEESRAARGCALPLKPLNASPEDVKITKVENPYLQGTSEEKQKRSYHLVVLEELKKFGDMVVEAKEAENTKHAKRDKVYDDAILAKEKLIHAIKLKYGLLEVKESAEVVAAPREQTVVPPKSTPEKVGESSPTGEQSSPDFIMDTPVSSRTRRSLKRKFGTTGSRLPLKKRPR